MTREGSAGVGAGYDRWAPTYDTDGNPMVALEGPHLRAAVGAVHGLRVLELGCGSGRHTQWLAEAGAQVVGVDVSPGMLAQARPRCVGLDVQLHQHDLEQPLPWPAHSFDLIVSALVLEHLASLLDFFREVRRQLRPGGRAVISAMHPAMLLRGVRARFVDADSGERVEPGRYPHQLGEMVMAMLDAGLHLRAIDEHAPDAELVRQYPRAEKYLEWPMLVLFELEAKATPA